MNDIEEFYLNIVYKNRKVKFRVTNPAAPLSVLMNNLKHATGADGKLIFDFPSIDGTGAPMDYFFGRENPEDKRIFVMRPRIGKTDQTLADYNVHSGDVVFIIPDPFPG